MMLGELVESFLRVGLGAYGGGLAVLRLLYHELVELRGWLRPEEMAEVVALAEMTPGPIAVNAATYTGVRLAGLAGAALATASVLLPSLFFLGLLVAFALFPRSRGWVHTWGALLRPGVLALLATAVVAMGQATVRGFLPGLFATLSFLFTLLLRDKIHPALLILFFGLVGLLFL